VPWSNLLWDNSEINITTNHINDRANSAVANNNLFFYTFHYSSENMPPYPTQRLYIG